jgi:hypothetical protein
VAHAEIQEHSQIFFSLHFPTTTSGSYNHKAEIFLVCLFFQLQSYFHRPRFFIKLFEKRKGGMAGRYSLLRKSKYL